MANRARRVPLSSMTPAARAARIKVLAANPGTRSAIPDKYLPAQYKAGRATAQRMKTENATLYNPAQILSGKDLRSAVKSEVDLQINPQVSALDRNISSLVGQRDVSMRRAGDYLGAYNKATAGAANFLSSSGQELASRLSQIGSSTQQAIQGFQQQANERNQADVALRGPGLSDTQPVSQAFDLEKGQAASQAGTYQAQGAVQAAGINDLGRTIAAVAPMRATDTMGMLAGKFNQQVADLYGKKADVEAQRGPLTAQTLNKMREDQFTNLATMKGLDIKQADLQETVRKNKATEGLTRDAINQKNLASVRTARSAHERAVVTRERDAANLAIKRGIDPITGKRLPKNTSPTAALAAWKLDFARKHGYLPQTGPGSGGPGGKPPLTANERITQAQKFGPIANQIKTAIVPDFPTDRHKGARTFLAANPNSDPLYVSIALDQAYDGHISKANTKKLKARGINVADLQGVTSYTEWQRKRRRGKTPAANIPATPGF